jgi:RecA/RadA recombinase
MLYKRICEGLNDRGRLVPKGSEYDYIKDPNKDYYVSIFDYFEDHKKKFDETGSVSGITDVTTNSLIWDFDAYTNTDQSKQDVLELATRLLKEGLNQDDFNIFYSGNKGFSLELHTTAILNPSDFKRITAHLSKGLATRDEKIVNASRIFRVPLTKHNTSGLFKIPLKLEEVQELSLDKIKELAKHSDNREWSIVEAQLPNAILALKDRDLETVKTSDPEIVSNFVRQIKWLSPCKEAILQGFFKDGMKHHALMALAATIKAQGLPQEITYRMLKGSCELQARRYNTEQVPKDNIWKIVKDVYSAHWQGKTYSCKDHEFLQQVCPSKNSKGCGLLKKEPMVKIESVANDFGKFAKDIDKNTIYTGIEPLDKRLKMLTNSHVVIAGVAGSGKTTLVLNILQNLSAKGSINVFGSLDMPYNLVYLKAAQKVMKVPDDTILGFHQKQDAKKIKEVDDAIAKAYSNTLFDFRRGVSIEDIRENMLAVKDRYGDQFKVAVYDYINKIQGPYSDETANLAYIAPRLADIADEAGILMISLAQVGRAKGGVSTPMNDSRVAKGSSAIEESASVLMGVWREGANSENDNFISIGVLKNRMGPEFKLDLHWEGMTSTIRSLSDEERMELDALRESKAISDDSDGGW